jgi:ribosomal-protein-alanine N-acetyltransferase
VVLKESGQFIGFVNYHNREPRSRRLAVGYILARAYWRRGLMTEAMRSFVAHCFTVLGAHRIEALIEPENAASLRLAQGLGFRREGLLRDGLLVADVYRNVEMHVAARGRVARLDAREERAGAPSVPAIL